MQETKMLGDIIKTRYDKDKHKQFINDIDSQIKHMQNASDVMEKENFEIEVKIHELKERMKKEKEERERMGGPRWQSSRKNQSQKAASANKARSIKVLKEQSIDKYYSRKPSSGKPQTSKSRDPNCGQCEKKQGKVRCNECCETYCTSCYKDFHGRGALRKHTWKTIDQVKNLPSETDTKKLLEQRLTDGKSKFRELYRNDLPSYSKETYEEESISFSDALAQCQKDSGYKMQTNESSHSRSDSNELWNGYYDEERNAREFADALAEWRMSAGKSNETKSTEVGTEAISVEKPSIQINVNIPQSSTLTYLDRIMVKRHKKEIKMPTSSSTEGKSQPSHQTRSESSRSINGSQVDISISPRQSSNSPCVLSLHFSDKPDGREDIQNNPISIDIVPCDDQSEYSEIETDETIPIIFTDESTDNEETEMTIRSKSRADGRIIEMDLTNPEIVVESEKALPEHSKTTNVSRPPQNQIKSKSFSPLIESPEYTRWTPSPTYGGMGKFFLIGATPCGDEKRETYELAASDGAGDFVAFKMKESWVPTDSTPKESDDRNDVGSLQRKISGVQKLAVYRDVSRKPSCDVAKFNIDNYDYIQALPPLIKGDNYEKIHRASTSLSIGITPFDIWQDNDSFPSSRRPSNLMNQVTSRRSIISKNGNSNDSGNINFDNIDRLADRIAESNIIEDE